MTRLLATCAALLWLLAAASCAPTAHTPQDACAAARKSSLNLNGIARTVSLELRNSSKDEANFSTSLEWMEARDMCDPGTLKHNPGPCLVKILRVLANYGAEVNMVAKFNKCSAHAEKVRPLVLKLQQDVAKCAMSWGDAAPGKVGASNTVEQHWQEDPRCLYTMDRLFSFSILVARVFATGDPTRHAESSALTCR